MDNKTYPITVYLALGSNLDDPLSQINSAIEAIKAIPETQYVTSSAFYRTKPLGGLEQPDYLNAVVKIETFLEAELLLDKTQEIETKHGRVRTGQRWGARTLDIDILLFGNQVIQSERLTIPHHGLSVREFMLYPLFDIAPELILPNGVVLSSLIEKTDKNGMEIW